MLNLYGILPPRRIEVEWLNVEIDEYPEWDEFIEVMKLLLLSDAN